MSTARYSLRAISRRPLRNGLTLFGISTGVATLISILSSMTAVRSAYREWFVSLSGNELLAIVAPGHAGFDAASANRLKTIPGIASVRPRIAVTAAFAEGSDGAPVMVYGYDKLPTEFRVRGDASFGAMSGVLLDERTATNHQWMIGTSIRLWTPKGELCLPVVGLLEPLDSTRRSGTSIIVLPLNLAQQYFNFPGQVNEIEVVLEPKTNAAVVEHWLAREIPENLRVSSSRQQGESLKPMMAAVEHGLSALGMIALVTAGFVIVNTFTMNLTERRRQFAILRAIGATQKQVTRLLLQESALMGLAGSIIGTGVGLAITPMMTHVFSAILGIEVMAAAPSWMLIVSGLLLGPLLSVAVTIGLAQQAAARSPLVDLTAAGGSLSHEEKRRFPWRSVIGLMAAMGLNYLLIHAYFPKLWENRVLAPSLALLQTATVPLLPLLFRPIFGLLGAGLQWLLPVEGRLARIQLSRRTVRTGLTAGVLFVASSTAVGFAHWLVDSLNDIKVWYSRSIVADYLVRGCMTDANFVLSAPLPNSVGEELATLPGVDRIDRVAFVPCKVNATPALLLARTFADDRPPAIDLREGDPHEVFQKLLAGDAVIGTGLAHRLGIQVGESIEIEGIEGSMHVRVVGTVTEYASGGEVVYLEWSKAASLLRLPGAHLFLVTAKVGKDGLSAETIKAFCNDRHLMLQSNADLREIIDRMPERLQVAMWILIALTFLLASIGVTNTLSMNIIEQAPELGTLRAIGMTRRQIRRLILGQAALFAIAGLSTGCIAGIGLAWLLTTSSNAVFGREVAFSIHLPIAIGCFAIGLLVTLIAALFPANRAMNLSRDSLRSRNG